MNLSEKQQSALLVTFFIVLCIGSVLWTNKKLEEPTELPRVVPAYLELYRVENVKIKDYPLTYKNYTIVISPHTGYMLFYSESEAEARSWAREYAFNNTDVEYLGRIQIYGGL